MSAQRGFVVCGAPGPVLAPERRRSVAIVERVAFQYARLEACAPERVAQIVRATGRKYVCLPLFHVDQLAWANRVAASIRAVARPVRVVATVVGDVDLVRAEFAYAPALHAVVPIAEVAVSRARADRARRRRALRSLVTTLLAVFAGRRLRVVPGIIYRRRATAVNAPARVGPRHYVADAPECFPGARD